MVREAESWKVGWWECGEGRAPITNTAASSVIRTFQPSNFPTFIAHSPICTPRFVKSPFLLLVDQRHLCATGLLQAAPWRARRDREGGAVPQHAAYRFRR